MHPKSPAQLREIRQRCQRIAAVAADLAREDYLASPEVQAQVERHLEVIGEAISRLARTDPVIADRVTDWRGIVGLRNVIAHGYDVIEQARLWEVIHSNLALLLEEVEVLLMEEEL
jgi:uncharacterized protein with HEPN domain